MATANRSTTGNLKDALLGELLAHGRQFDFYQAVRVLLALQPDATTPGQNGQISREAIRFRANASLGFPASDVESVERETTTGSALPPYAMTVNFLGLIGPASPLPAYYTEEVIRADPDAAMAQHFLDMFHHRFTSFVYRSWEKYRYIQQYRPGARDAFSNRMFALIGLGHRQLRQEGKLEWARLLPYLGLLGMKVRSASLLSSVVSHYFGGVPVSVQEYVRQKTAIDPMQRNSLGVANCALGVNGMLGEKVYDVNTKFRLRLGALDFDAYSEFLPNGSDYAALRELVRFTLIDPFEYDVELLLRAENVPSTTLAVDNPCRLGHSTWLGDVRQGVVKVVQTGAV
jgi:type VI secretion system protein ImpH